MDTRLRMPEVATTQVEESDSRPALERATILLDAGANMSARDEEYRSTPLAWAERRPHTEIVSILRQHGAA